MGVRTGIWCANCELKGHHCQAQVYVEADVPEQNAVTDVPFCLPCRDGEPCSVERVGGWSATQETATADFMSGVSTAKPEPKAARKQPLEPQEPKKRAGAKPSVMNPALEQQITAAPVSETTKALSARLGVAYGTVYGYRRKHGWHPGQGGLRLKRPASAPPAVKVEVIDPIEVNVDPDVKAIADQPGDFRYQTEERDIEELRTLYPARSDTPIGPDREQLGWDSTNFTMRWDSVEIDLQVKGITLAKALSLVSALISQSE